MIESSCGQKHVRKFMVVSRGRFYLKTFFFLIEKWPWVGKMLTELQHDGQILIFVKSKAGVDELSKRYVFFQNSVHKKMF